MLKSDLPLLACPVCRASPLAHRPSREDFALPPGFDPAIQIWEGELVCGVCGHVFPLLEGVACLGVLNRDWRIPLKEITSKISSSMRLTRRTHWETGRGKARDEQLGEVGTLMDYLFDCAVAEMDFSSHPKILDLGCGGGATTDRFIALGARAIGVDTDIGLLRHISFEGIDQLPPASWRHPESGHVFEEKSTRPLAHYFTRVFADICRLPFQEGAFDMVFCRSVLHHLDDHRRILRGAMRALRPGGKVVFCSEPLRSILTIESEYMAEETIECEEGMNERVWPLWHYLGPIFPLTRDAMVQVWPNDPTPSLVRRTLGLAWPLRRRIGPGARVRGWKLPALAFVNASFNLYATRNESQVEDEENEEKALRSLPDAAFQELTALFRVRPGEGAAGPADLPRKRAVLERLRREIMALEMEDGEAPPDSVETHDAPQFSLENGWLKKIEHEGRRGRLASWDAAIFLKRRPGAGRIEIVAACAAGSDASLRVVVNGLDAGAANVGSDAWGEYAFDIPKGIDEKILTVRLLSQAPGAADPSAPPLMIASIAQR